MGNIRKCNPENAAKYDVKNHIRFQCLIGQTEPELYIMIEPDPHGSESGRDGHFHAVVTCQNQRVSDIPTEPDRCRITNNTCLFAVPAGSHERDPNQRKFLLANKIVQRVAFIEFYGSQIVNKILESKGVKKKLDDLKVWELNNILLCLGIIDNKTFGVIDNLRKKRNTLAHNPEGHLIFSEKHLYELSVIAEKTASTLKSKLQNAVESTK